MTNSEETVNHPQHYQGASIETRHILNRLGLSLIALEQECIFVIERFPLIYGGFHMGNALKYLWRCGQKCDRVEDLKKAKWYLQRYLDYCNPGNPRQIEDAIVLIDQLIEKL